MYNNGYNNPQLRKVKATPAVWVLRVLLAITFAGSQAGTILQIYDSAPYGIFGTFSGGGLVALCVIAGIILTAIMYVLYALLLRLGYNSLARNLTYMGVTPPDLNYICTVTGSAYVCANAVNTMLSLLSVFYTSQLYVLSEFLALIVKLLAMAAIMLVLWRKTGKEYMTFVFAAFAPLFAVTAILL